MAILDHVGVDHLVEKISEKINEVESTVNNVRVDAVVAKVEAVGANSKAEEALKKPNNIEIIYTTTDGNKLIDTGQNTLVKQDTYENGRGVLVVNTVNTTLLPLHLGNSNRFKIASITLPYNYFTSMSFSIFFTCSSLEAIEIPDSITTIGPSAFTDCSSLRMVKLGASLTRISDFTFSGCTSLESIEIPDSVTSIGDRAFFGCSSLTSVSIGNSVTSIGDRAFYNCKVVNSYEIHAITPPSLGASVFNGAEDYKIYVPLESVDAYKQAENWSTYANRIVGVVFEDDNLVSGENIKTVNGQSLLGSGDIEIAMEGDYLPLSGGTVDGGINCKSIFINNAAGGLTIADLDGGPIFGSDSIDFEVDDIHIYGSDSTDCSVSINGDLNFSGSMSSGTIEGGTW